MFWNFSQSSGWKSERKLCLISFSSFIPCFKLLYEKTTKNVVTWRDLQVTIHCTFCYMQLPRFFFLYPISSQIIYIHTFPFSTSFILFIYNISLRSFQSQAFKYVQCGSIFYPISFCYQWFYSLTSVLFFWISVATWLFI